MESYLRGNDNDFFPIMTNKMYCVWPLYWKIASGVEV